MSDQMSVELQVTSEAFEFIRHFLDFDRSFRAVLESAPRGGGQSSGILRFR